MPDFAYILNIFCGHFLCVEEEHPGCLVESYFLIGIFYAARYLIPAAQKIQNDSTFCINMDIKYTVRY